MKFYESKKGKEENNLLPGSFIVVCCKDDPLSNIIGRIPRWSNKEITVSLHFLVESHNNCVVIDRRIKGARPNTATVFE